MPKRKPSILLPVRLTPRLLEPLGQLFTLHKLYEAAHRKAALAACAPDIVGIVTFGKIDAVLIEALPKLEIIANYGVGIDGIDLDAARRRGVAVTNTPGVLTDAVADLAVALLLAVTRRVVEGDTFVRAGRWMMPERLPLGLGLRGRVCGIVGMGRIGQGIAARVAAMGMFVAWHGPRPKPALRQTYVEDLASLADQSDVLVIACHGGEGTRRIIDRDVLRRLGPRGYLINIARGSVIDEPALIEALRHNGIAGAGLDVFENEPAITADFVELPNTVLLPHLGSATEDARGAMADLVIANLAAHFEGRPLPTPVG